MAQSFVHPALGLRNVARGLSKLTVGLKGKHQVVVMSAVTGAFKAIMILNQGAAACPTEAKEVAAYLRRTARAFDELLGSTLSEQAAEMRLGAALVARQLDVIAART